MPCSSRCQAKGFNVHTCGGVMRSCQCPAAFTGKRRVFSPPPLCQERCGDAIPYSTALGFILFVFCSTIYICALFTASQLLSFSVLFATSKTGFTRAMQICTSVGTAALNSIICFKICDFQYHPASAIFHTNLIPGSL